MFFWYQFKPLLLFFFFKSCHKIKLPTSVSHAGWCRPQAPWIKSLLPGFCFLVLWLHFHHYCRLTLLTAAPSSTWQNLTSFETHSELHDCILFSLSSLQLNFSHILSPELVCTFTAFKFSHHTVSRRFQTTYYVRCHWKTAHNFAVDELGFMKIRLVVFLSTPYKNKVAFKDWHYLGKCQTELFNSKLMFSHSKLEELKAASKWWIVLILFSIQLPSCSWTRVNLPSYCCSKWGSSYFF